MPKKRTATSLKQSLYRLMLIPALAWLLILVGIIMLSNRLVFDEIEKEQILSVQNIASLGGQYLKETQVLLQNLADLASNLSPEDRDRLLVQTQANYPRFTALYLLDVQGRVLSESKLADTPPLLGFDLSGEPYFGKVRTLLKPYFSDTFYSIAIGDIAVTVAQPILQDSELKGVLVGELNLYDLQDAIEDMAMYPQDTIFVLDERNTVVIHPNRDLVRQQVSMGNIAIARQGALRPITRIFEMDGTWVFASAAPMENGWVVVISRSLWDAASPLLWLAGGSLLAFVASIAIFAFGIQRSVQRISAPISRLAEKAEAISTGNYSLLEDTITDGRYRELNALTASFNHMVETVRLRTVEIMRTNQQLMAELEERQRIEAAMRESESRYRSLFENTPISIWEEDFSGAKRYLDQIKEKYGGDWFMALAKHPGLVAECASRVQVLAVNQATLEMHGATSKDALIKRLSEIFTVEAPVTFSRELEAIWHGWPGVEIEGRIKTLSGELRHVMVKWTVLPDHQAAYDRVLLSLVDITPHKLAEMELKQHREHLEESVRERTAKLERANQELESFAYTVSHDLRAPLRHIDGYSNILAEEYVGHLDEQGRFLLDNVRKSAQNMSRMIDGLLQLSRTSRGELTVVYVDLSAIATEISQELAENEPGRTVEWTISPGCHVQGDARLLRAALQNLLENAWKFTRTRTLAHIVFGRLDPEQARVRFSVESPVFFVRDNGAGFNMKYAAKIFTPFQRLHTEEQFAGTGIGLATVQRIIRRHGGEIWVESEPDAGTTFFFNLP